MTIQAALKEDLSQSPAGYDQGLLDRLLAWQELTGNSNNVVARMINRSAAAVSQYKNQKYPGNVAEIEKEIAQMLRREEEMEFTAPGTQFCNTGPAKLIWEVLQFCDEQQDMGIAVGPAGIGKTQTCNEYFRRNRATVFITADIATRSVGSVLWMLAKRVGVTPKTRSNSNLLHAVIRQLKDSHRLVLMAAFPKQQPADPLGLALLIRKGERLYGRYWGCAEPLDSLHFNTCFYRPIEWAIDQGIEIFDPGMGAHHKLRRGIPSVGVYSLHRFTHPTLQGVMDHHMGRINRDTRHQIDALNRHLPFARRQPQ